MLTRNLTSLPRKVGRSPLPKRVSPPSVGDRFQPSPRISEENPTYTNLARARASTPEGSKLRKYAQALGLALSLGSTFAGGAALAEPALVENVMMVESQTKIQQALEMEEFQDTVQSLPTEFAETMASLNDTQIRVLGGGINGKTKVGLITVNNRKAFIKGTAYGQDVWPHVHKSVENVSARPDIQLPDPERRELHEAVEMMKDLSKSQRKGLAEVMDVILTM